MTCSTSLEVQQLDAFLSAYPPLKLCALTVFRSQRIAVIYLSSLFASFVMWVAISWHRFPFGCCYFIPSFWIKLVMMPSLEIRSDCCTYVALNRYAEFEAPKENYRDYRNQFPSTSRNCKFAGRARTRNLSFWSHCEDIVKPMPRWTVIETQ